ncbi:ABC transporter ATP-binding protein [Fimbriimonas ginsengisoli]|uniref:Heme exporter protein CcmA n=1 Tax=Fimbriimonas ginsengisoli Gsoil 348 TaxID=661478 RepID=A0A068NR11_FIMGI|nr:ABC transporter ATP-binding protein [Fimbriimonas ginsengisoli]AIE85876.1 heme exporter protein CcmA [Fimbriimonas ginsengisoli Gsoil 348]
MEAGATMGHNLHVLRVDRLGKRYGDRWIFRGLSFQLNLGDRLVIVGRNGAGKSTLLRTLAGLLSPSEGKVDLPEGDPRLTLGLSALEQALYPQLTVEEHLKLAADLRGCPPRSEELLDQIGLTYARRYPAGQLSTGMKARLKLAIATQAHPKLLLLDEPGAGLDEEGRALVKQIADEQRGRGCLVMATNDPSERRLAELELELAN